MRISDWSSDVCSSDLTAPRRGVDGAHHPEVDQSEATVRLHEQVAGVRVGMEEPVLEDHRQHHVDDASSEVRSVDARGVERLEIRHLDPGDPLAGDDPPSAGALVDEWAVPCRVRRPVGRETPGEYRTSVVWGKSVSVRVD